LTYISTGDRVVLLKIDMAKNLLINVSSCSAEVYSLVSHTPKLLLTHQIAPGENSTKDIKICLYKLITKLQREYPHTPIQITTKDLPQRLSTSEWEDIVNEFYLTTGVLFSAVDADNTKFVI
jgi:hypothetical protein